MSVQTPCKIHKEYRAIRRPTSPCIYCWRQYLGQAEPDQKVSKKELALVLNAFIRFMEIDH